MTIPQLCIRLAAAFVLGAVLSIALAVLASVGQVGATIDYGDPTPADLGTWARSIPPGCPPAPASTTLPNHLALGYYTVYVFGGSNAEVLLYIVRAGLPFKYLEGTEFQDGVSPAVVAGLVRLPSGRYLPIRPVWIPFLLNSALLGGTLFLLASGWRRLRRARRERAGRCRACGHPLAGSDRCPECGVSRRRAQKYCTALTDDEGAALPRSDRAERNARGGASSGCDSILTTSVATPSLGITDRCGKSTANCRLWWRRRRYTDHWDRLPLTRDGRTTLDQ